MNSGDTEGLRIDIQAPEGSWVSFGRLYSRNDINWFEADQSYWERDFRPVVGQYFEERGYSWVPKQTRVALPHWFGHLLPEGMLRQVVAHELSVHESRDFQLLRALGSDDLPGALRAVPIDGAGLDVPHRPDNQVEGEESDHPDDFKFSLAGVQLKFSVLASGRSVTMPIRGQAGNAILKVPDPRPGFRGVPEAEFAAMRLAGLAGLDVADTELIDVRQVIKHNDWISPNSSTGLLVDRFDRAGTSQRVHAEQLAQVMWIPAKRQDAKYSYANFETIASMVGGICGVEYVRSVIDRLVFNVLIGNGDAHLKNWSLLYADGRTPTLSPAYDIVPTVLYVGEDNLGLNLDGSKAFEDVTSRSFDRLGAVTGLGVWEARAQATDAVARVMTVWDGLRDYLDQKSFDRLDSRISTLPLTRGSEF